jgi:hypothetical protein
MTYRFCEECSCDGKPQAIGEGGVYQEKNWPCPLLYGKNICQICCRIELAGGMGASDTLDGMARKTGKTVPEIHATCVGCTFGGPELEEPPELASMRGKDGTSKTSGPEFETHRMDLLKEWYEQLDRVAGKRVPRRPAHGPYIFEVEWISEA